MANYLDSIGLRSLWARIKELIDSETTAREKREESFHQSLCLLYTPFDKYTVSIYLGASGTTEEVDTVCYENSLQRFIGVKNDVAYSEWPGSSTYCDDSGKPVVGRIYALLDKESGNYGLYIRKSEDSNLTSLGMTLSDYLLNVTNTSGDTYIAKNITPNGTKFSYATDINFDEQELVAEIDLSTCLTTDTNEGVLSIGENIDLWGTDTSGAGNVIHIYYTANTGVGIVWCFNNYVNQVKTSFALSSTSSGVTTMEIHLSKAGGLTINGTQYVTAAQCANILALSALSVGSQEGTVRSYATYNYIKLAKI